MPSEKAHRYSALEGSRVPPNPPEEASPAQKRGLPHSFEAEQFYHTPGDIHVRGSFSGGGSVDLQRLDPLFPPFLNLCIQGFW